MVFVDIIDKKDSVLPSSPSTLSLGLSINMNNISHKGLLALAALSLSLIAIHKL